MSRFAAIPEIPTGTSPELIPVLQAMKQNLEALTGQRGTDRLSQAVTFGGVGAGDALQTSVVAATNPPTKAEFDAVIADLGRLVDSFNYLVAQLRGEDVGT